MADLQLWLQQHGIVGAIAFLVGYVLSQRGAKIPLLSEGGPAAPASPQVIYAPAPAPAASPVKVQLETPSHAVTVDGANINVTKKE